MSASARFRQLSPLDRILGGVGHALNTTFGSPQPSRPSPGDTQPHVDLDFAQRRHVAGLMRINHTGEVCAQALYLGQSALARDDDTRNYLLDAAREENDHLAWCHQRLLELDARGSLFNPLWYAGSYAIGIAAAAANDATSLGFVVETERQVEAHLGEHLQRLPDDDQRSRAILQQMQTDEAAHAEHAQQRGGTDLPAPIPTLMRWTSKLMKAVAYRV